MEKKVEYVREHYSKEVRKSLIEGRNTHVAAQSEEKNKVDGYTLRRKKQRVWTLNRSPHGNKTAREQFGRQVWQRRVKRTQEDGLTRRKQVREKENQYVTGKEIQTQTLDN